LLDIPNVERCLLGIATLIYEGGQNLNFAIAAQQIAALMASASSSATVRRAELVRKTGKEVRLVSRNQVGFKYPELINVLKLLSAQNIVIDGEIAALDQNGKASFQLLQGYGRGKQGPPLIYYAFDLLSLNGTDLRNRPLIERRKALAKLLAKAPDNIRFSEELRGSADELLQVARQYQLEGFIAKRPDSVYGSGRRSGADNHPLNRPAFDGTVHSSAS
jgi:hypothetical protein